MDNSDNQISQQQIVDELKQYSLSKVPFIEAKNNLLAKGYSEEAISQAADEFSYDGPPTSDIPTQAEHYFEHHPREAVEDGQNLLKAEHKEELQDAKIHAALDIAASVAAPRIDKTDIQVRVNYENKFANDAGTSYWLLVSLLFVVNIASFAIVDWLKISRWFYLVNGLLSLSLIIYLIKRIK